MQKPCYLTYICLGQFIKNGKSFWASAIAPKPLPFNHLVQFFLFLIDSTPPIFLQKIKNFISIFEHRRVVNKDDRMSMTKICEYDRKIENDEP